MILYIGLVCLGNNKASLLKSSLLCSHMKDRATQSIAVFKIELDHCPESNYRILKR